LLLILIYKPPVKKNRDLVEAREQKRQRTVISCLRLVDAEEDMTHAVEEEEPYKDENRGKPNDNPEASELVTDAAADYDDEEIEGHYDAYGIRVVSMTRQPGDQDEIDWAARQYKCSKSYCIVRLAFLDLADSGILLIVTISVVLYKQNS
jgi:hypothetical protein